MAGFEPWTPVEGVRWGRSRCAEGSATEAGSVTPDFAASASLAPKPSGLRTVIEGASHCSNRARTAAAFGGRRSGSFSRSEKTRRSRAGSTSISGARSAKGGGARTA